MMFSELVEQMPEINWKVFLAKATAQTGIVVDGMEKVNIIGLPYLRQLHTVLALTSPRTLANYLMWNLVSSYTSYVSKVYRGPYRKFRKVYSGVSADTPRWTECVGMTRGFMAWPLSAMYVDQYFDPSAKQEMDKLVHNLRDIMKINIQHVAWMDARTRNAALLKLSRMGQKIGYPDYIHNESKVMEDYQGVVLSKDHYFGNVVRVTELKIARAISKVREQVTQTSFSVLPNQSSSPPATLNKPRVTQTMRTSSCLGGQQRVGRDAGRGERLLLLLQERDRLPRRHPAIPHLLHRRTQIRQLPPHRNGHRPRNHTRLRRSGNSFPFLHTPEPHPQLS